MHVVMLGWEYPPHISGGLGTACQGLTQALAPKGVDITFVVPYLYGGEHAPHMILVAPPPAPRAVESFAGPPESDGEPSTPSWGAEPMPLRAEGDEAPREFVPPPLGVWARALHALGVLPDEIFEVPRARGDAQASRLDGEASPETLPVGLGSGVARRVRRVAFPAALSPYWSAADYAAWRLRVDEDGRRRAAQSSGVALPPSGALPAGAVSGASSAGRDASTGASLAHGPAREAASALGVGAETAPAWEPRRDDQARLGGAPAASHEGASAQGAGPSRATTAASASWQPQEESPGDVSEVRGREPAHYGGDLFAEIARYAGRVHAWAQGERFDLVHAHDWMTFPTGVALADSLGIPLVVQVHSLEQDRSGSNGDPRILAIEKAGLERADRIVAVSHYTRKLIHEVHGIPLAKIEVVHNGVYSSGLVQRYREEGEYPGPVVLFLGRITRQKGPDYFVEAAAKVIPRVANVTFVMAGSGDMLPFVRERVRELDIEQHFRFPGFVSGPEVERYFSTASVYVMPSVSEPFGITALEAMSHDTPTILSRQSGAAELLRHALKVDFWDVDKLASHMLALLTYPELRASLVEMARQEVRRVHWDAAADTLLGVYRGLLDARGFD